MSAGEHYAYCNLCSPVLRLPLDELHVHMRVEHDLDIDEQAEKWPDGEYVIHYDESLITPEDIIRAD